MILRLVWIVVVAAVACAFARADDWPEWRGPGRSNAWHEAGIRESFPAEGLKARWRAPVGFGYSSPVVAGGRVFLTDLQLGRAASHERIQCFDETTGRNLWTHAYPVDPPDWAFTPGQETGPNATPTVDSGRVYSLGWHGHLRCLDAATGALEWKRDLSSDFPAAELRTTSSPLVDGDRLILVIGAKPDAAVLAVDKRTGRDRWRALGEGAGYSSPILLQAGGALQLIVWTPESLSSLDPVTGGILWRHPMAIPADMVVSTPVTQAGRLLVAGMMWRLDDAAPGASLVWPEDPKPTRRVFSVTSTALLLGDHVYSARLTGELVCVEAATGRQLWATNAVTDLKPGASLHLTACPDSVLIYTDRGELIRARLTPAGYRELSRMTLLNPTTPFGGRNVAWAPPAYARGQVFARNSQELVCVSLRE